MTSVLCLFIGAALPVLVLGLLIRRAVRQLHVATAYGEVSRQLGLDVDTRGVSLQGHLGEQRIWVGEVMVGHGPQRKMTCWGVLDLERPLGLGLLLRRRGLRDRLRRPRGPRVALAGDDLDRLVELHGDEPDRVRALLDSEVRELLHGMLRRWRDVAVTDQSVRVYLREPLARTDDLRELVDGMLALASSLARARRAVPPPTALQPAVEAWQGFAHRLGLELEPAFPGAAGVLDGRAVRITPVRTGDGYSVELRLGLRPHRRTGLRLRPQVEPDGYWSVGQDIQLGEASFDRSFVVKGWDPDLVRDLLSPPVRQGLLALHQVGRIDLDDLRLYVGQLPADPGRLEPVVVQAARTAECLGW